MCNNPDPKLRNRVWTSAKVCHTKSPADPSDLMGRVPKQGLSLATFNPRLEILSDTKIKLNGVFMVNVLKHIVESSNVIEWASEQFLFGIDVSSDTTFAFF